MVIDRLYYSIHPFENAAQASFVFDESVLKAAVRRIYEKNFNPVTEIEEGVFNETWNIFNRATDEGFGKREYSDPDFNFYEELRYNNAVFSAFRTHRLQNDIADQLTDENGKLKSFDKFAADVEPIADHNVRHWLRTEYDTAVLRAHQAADWRQFKEVKDILPNLRWMPTTSVTPDKVHRRYWEARLTLPQDHPFWNEHRPGDRWNCKCSLEATDDPVRGKHVIDDGDQPEPDRGLDNNPGKDARLFSDTHPFMPNSCAACTLPGKKGSFINHLTGFSNAGKKDCYNCLRPDQLIQKARNNNEGARAVRKWAKENIQGATVKHSVFKNEILISGGSIREFTNQPHKWFFEKNDLLKNLQNVFNSAIYMGLKKYDAKVSHIFEIELMGEKSYIIVNEYKGSKPTLYSISDSDKVLIGIEKP